MKKVKYIKIFLLKGASWLLSGRKSLWTLVSGLSFLLLVQGCTPAISPGVKRGVSQGLTFQEVIRAPDNYVGETVLWGGKIISTINRADGTEIEVIQKPLDYSDRPVEDISTSRGRFLIHTVHFLDSEVYKSGKELTVAGTIRGKREKKIGELTYAYPLLDPLEIKLWEPQPVQMFPEYPPYYRDPFYYDPFYYDPFYYDPFFSPYQRRRHPIDWHPPHGSCSYWHPPSYNEDNC